MFLTPNYVVRQKNFDETLAELAGKPIVSGSPSSANSDVDTPVTREIYMVYHRFLLKKLMAINLVVFSLNSFRERGVWFWWAWAGSACPSPPKPLLFFLSDLRKVPFKYNGII